MTKLGKVSVETKAIVANDTGPVLDPAVVPPGSNKIPLARGFGA